MVWVLVHAGGRARAVEPAGRAVRRASGLLGILSHQHRVVDRCVVTAGEPEPCRLGGLGRRIRPDRYAGPGFSFGQREHACVLFAMPYLATAVLRLQGGQGPRTSIAVAIGLLAGIGFALKPYFLAVPALVELLLLVRLGWRSLFVRVESLVLGFTVLAYVVTAGLLIPDYLKATIELARATYWAYDTGNFSVILERFVRVVQPALYGALIALVTRTWSRQHTVMLVAGTGFAVSYFVQSKGFVYHAYPVLVCSVAFLGICLGQGLTRAWTAWRETGNSLRFALVPVVVLLALPPIKQAHDDVVRWYFTYNIEWGPTGQFRQAVIDTVNQFRPDHRSRTFSPSRRIHFPAFRPLPTRSPNGRVGPLSQPFIPAYARLDEVTDPAIRERRGSCRGSTSGAWSWRTSSAGHRPSFSRSAIALASA